MFNITGSIGTIKDAESIATSTVLTDEERVSLLTDLKQSIPIMVGCPSHLHVAQTVIERLLNDAGNRTAAKAQGKNRKAKRGEEPSSVDTQGTEEEAQETPRASEGIDSQAEDAGSADSPLADTGTSST